MSEVDRTTLNILLAALDIEQRELASRMGYDDGYVSNVFNGCLGASPAFRRAFGETVAAMLFGVNESVFEESYEPAPLLALIERAASEAPSKRDFYRDLGTSPQSLHNRKRFDGLFVDRICCELGVHPTSVYGTGYDVKDAS